MRLGEILRGSLPTGGLGESLYAFESIDSTNTFAARLAQAGGDHGTVIVAEAQSRGRGRRGARWHSPPGSSLSLSVLLRPQTPPGLRLAGLGALATAEALAGINLDPRIKWPNDVLLAGRKVSGVLAESAFEGDRLLYVIVGIGVNVGAEAVDPEADFDFPATSVEAAAGRRVPLVELTVEIVHALGTWYQRIESAAFLEAWQSRLAYLGERVRVEAGGRAVEGRLLGLEPDGAARVEIDLGRHVRCGAEASRMRPVDSRRD